MAEAEGLPMTTYQREDRVIYDYEKVLTRILTKGEEEGISDKEQGVRLGVSERVIRRCKQGMTDIDADLVCTRGLGLHPAIVFGLDAWVDEPGLEDRAVASEAKKARERKAS